MDMNYLWIVLAVVAAIILIGWLIRRNIRDRKKFERDFLQSDIQPEKHKDQENDGV